MAAAVLGDCLEALLTGGQRVAGAHHTPPAVAQRVVALAVGPEEDEQTAPTGRAVEVARSVCDPAVGGGVFLLAVAERLHREGLGPAEVLDRLWGFDVDPLAVAVTEAALALWAGSPWPKARERLVVGDFLDAAVGRVRPEPGWSLIVGNPPFQSQLARRTARDRGRADLLARRFGDRAGGYVDEAGLFTLAGVEHLAERGRLALVVPASLLASTAAAPVRASVTGQAGLRALWVPDRPLFAAAVDVVVPVFEHGAPRRDVVTLARGGPADAAALRRVPSPGPDWAALLADTEGVPRVDLGTGAGCVGEMADVTAGFRQQFYGLAAAVGEADSDPTEERLLITVGLVDPLTIHWGRRATRLAGTSFRRPVVDPHAIDDADVAAWVQARQRPKVVVATQTRVIEAAVDVSGSWVPSTPLISVEPHDADTDLWSLAAVLCAPPVTAWFHRRGAGAGLSAGRIRPTAGRVREVPLPSDRALWASGATIARRVATEPDPARRRALLLELGGVMAAAYGTDDDLTTWWADLLPSP
jgi:hypothetical protein